MSSDAEAHAQLELVERWLPFALPLLLLFVLFAYLPSLGGGYLNLDDPGLLANNPLLLHPSIQGFIAIWTDFSRPTRLILGAEYLPLRDVSYFIESLLFGLRPLPLRIGNLMLYLGVVVVIYRLMRGLLQRACLAWLATAVFALHPVHVESVAWISGRKDVLALLFSALAMEAYVARRSHCAVRCGVFFALAMLSKSMSVALPLLLPLFDLWKNRRPDYRVIAWSFASVALLMPFHVHVGHLVGMVQPLAGGNLTTALSTMGPVWLRYVGVVLWPGSCSLVHDVPVLVNWTAPSVLGYAVIGLGLLLAWWFRAKSANSRLLVVWGFLWFPLLPVSQVIAPLQNQMTDRYLWWSVMALAWCVVWIVERSPRLGSTVALLWVAMATAVTSERAAMFGDSASVFADATSKTSESPVAPYQLAMALEERGDIAGARVAYEQVWQRTQGHHEVARRATNNLARLEARLGHLDRAETVLLRGLPHFPNDPKMVGNLAQVRAMKVQQHTR